MFYVVVITISSGFISMIDIIVYKYYIIIIVFCVKEVTITLLLLHMYMRLQNLSNPRTMELMVIALQLDYTFT